MCVVYVCGYVYKWYVCGVCAYVYVGAHACVLGVLCHPLL